MRGLRYTLVFVLFAACIALPGRTNAQAQGQSWLQVWIIPAAQGTPAVIEYRDAADTVQASYVLTLTDLFTWRQVGGRVYWFDSHAIPVFDPVYGTIDLIPAPGRLADTADQFFTLSSVVPSPDGQRVAYGIMRQTSDWDQPTDNWIYVGTTAIADSQPVFQQQGESSLAVQPVGWSADGSRLLIHDQPVGIGGYILFWQNRNVRTLDLQSGAITPLGDLDGWSQDVQLTVQIATGPDGTPAGLAVTQLTTGQTITYPLPAIQDTLYTGGAVRFAPSGARVAYQVARGNPDSEKYYTVVVDLTNGQSKVVLEDQAQNWDVRYGNIGGWLDDNTLVVGGTSSQQSAVIDVTTGQLLREERGAFLGYAVGLTSAAGFAPSGMAYARCGSGPVSRLGQQMRGRVTFTDGALTNVRTMPATGAELAGQVPEGATFSVMDGPDCADGYMWWYLNFDSGLSGFVAEGNSGAYFLEPWQ